MLSFDEATLLEKVTTHFPGQLNVLIFDGVYTRCDTFTEEARVAGPLVTATVACSLRYRTQ